MTQHSYSAEELKQKDQENIWHAMRPHTNQPAMIAEEADGAWITDIDGNQILDGMAGIWCVNAGYGRKAIADAAYEQMLKLPYYPLTQSHVPAIELSEKLNEWLDGEYVYFYSNSGSEANETAFKAVRQYFHQKGEGSRHKFISRYRSYHGNTLATLAATGQPQRKYKYEPLGQGFLHVTPPDSYRCPAEHTPESFSKACADEIEHAVTWELSETVAAVILEPIITGGGILIPHEDYLKRVREICDRHGMLMIVDEVICGFGRTGKPFGFMHYDVQPDIITMAKGITSGYLPLSATAVRKDIYDAFKGTDAHDHFRHVNTFGGNAAACAAAIKNLEIMEEEDLIGRSARLGEQMLQRLTDELSRHPYVGDVRGKGLLAGIEFVKDKQTKEPLAESEVKKVMAACKARGVIIGKTSDTVAGYNNILTLSPPLSLTDDDVNLLVGTLIEEVYNQMPV
ncbi:adenosylmethionine-8-amino-7-oxononanoate aminotransferase [Salsuginibacillus halophilus]|uniref:Adenosylmethionine-8-amino-7-oxononanoate aminotransferase n=1 Tax=Salsuginibacillus halophilus TaxID=517424 RepID=A0A2P8H9Q3_9BACI|nr:aspartate aminotransferase family protein [Salsuginibacillus halophilus]PSL42948.1 adenosylmethionine-8-amino-7-oxononanoate aminotransferase [Salsuginibacillus halophilus]